MEPVDELRANNFARRSPPRSRHQLHPSAAGGSGPPSTLDSWNQSATLRSPSENEEPKYDHEVASSAALPDRDRDEYFGDEKRDRTNRNSGFTELSIPDNLTARNANAAHYTFYREPTPPPVLLPDDEDDDRRRHEAMRARVAAGAAASLGKEGMLPSTSLGGSEESEDERRRGGFCCGASRKGCVVMLLALAFLVVAIGLGLGLGLGLRNNSVGQSSSTAAGVGTGSSSSSSISSTPTPTSTNPSSTSESPSSTSSSISPGTTRIARTDCPAENGTTYSPPGASKSFLRLCGVDYADSGGAVDISKFPASNMGECMNACAATLGCTGCSWGILDGEDVKHPCVLKKDLKTARKMDPDWCFAILQ